MSDSAENNPPSTPAPSLKKKESKTFLLAAVVVVIAVALIAIVVFGGLVNADNRTTLEKIQDRGKLIVGTDVPYSPFEYLNSTSGKYEGVDMEIIQKIADDLGVDLEIRPMSFTSLIGAVQTGKIDVAISAMTITAEREESVDFSNPYYDANQACVVLKDSSIASIADLDGLKCAVQLGTTGQTWVEDNLVDTGNMSSSDLSKMETVDLVALAIEQEQVEFGVFDTPIANAYAADSTSNLKVAFTIITNEQYGIAMKSGETELAGEINASITKMKQDGSLQEIFDKYNV